MVPGILEIVQIRGSSDFLERVQIREISRRGLFAINQGQIKEVFDHN